MQINCNYYLKENNQVVSFTESEIRDYLSLRFSKAFGDIEKTFNMFKSKIKLETKDKTDQKVHNYIFNDNGKERKVISTTEFINKTFPDISFNRANYIKVRKKQLFTLFPDASTQYVDTLIRDELKRFEESAEKGTDIHAIAEAIIDFYNEKGKLPNISDLKINTKHLSVPQRESAFVALRQKINFIIDAHTVKGQKPKLYSEMSIFGNIKNEIVGGTIDIGVVESTGKVITYDFKTSTKEADEWNNYKKETIIAQQKLYQNYLKQQGINSESVIIPVLIEEDVISVGTDIESSTIEIPFNKLIESIDSLFETVQVTKRVTDLLHKVNKFMKEVFNSKERTIQPSKEYIEQEVEKLKSNYSIAKENLQKPLNKRLPSGSFYIYNDKIYHRYVNNDGKKVDTEIKETTDFVELVVNMLRSKQTSSSKFRAYIAQVRSAKSKGSNENIDFSTNDLTNKNINLLLRKYIDDDNWVVYENDELNALGVIIFYNPKTKIVDTVSMSQEDFHRIFKLGLGSTILGNKYKDGIAKNKYFNISNSDLKTITAIKALSFLSEDDMFTDYKLGDVKLFNYSSGTYFMNPSQVIEDFNIIAKEYGYSEFKNKRVTDLEVFLSIVSQVPTKYEFLEKNKELMLSPDFKQLAKENDNVRRIYDRALHTMKELQTEMLRKGDIDNDLYMYLSKAILEMNNIEINPFDDIQKYISKEENPDTAFLTLPSDYRNDVMKALYQITSNVQQNVTKKFLNFEKRFKKILEPLYQEKLFYSEKIIDTTGLAFSNLFESPFLLKKPTDSSLSSVEKEFIKNYIDLMYELKKGIYIEGDIEDLIENDIKLRQVPLVPGSIIDNISQNTPKDAIINIWDSLFPKEYNPLVKERNRILSSFRKQDDMEERERMLQNGVYTTNLEIALNALAISLIKEEETNKALPTIEGLRATIGFLSTKMGKDIPNLNEAFEEFVDKNIYGNTQQSESPTLDHFLRLFKKFSAVTQLGLSPLFFTTQFLQNFFTTAINVLPSYVSNKGYKYEDFVKAIGSTLGKESLSAVNINFNEKLNEEYLITSMDQSYLASRLSTGSQNFFSKLFRGMNIYPDYFWRITHFKAFMIKDGSLDAHSVVNDEFIYEPEKDKRFEIYLSGQTNSPEYKKQEALYKLLLEELSNEDGVKYTRAPRAYSRVQKDIFLKMADDMFGAQSDRDRLIFQYGAFGAIFMQFRTWALAYKSRYTYHTSERLTDDYDFVDVVKLDEQGNPTGEIEKVAVRKKKLHEGIWQTLTFVVPEFMDAVKTGNYETLKNLPEYKKENLVKLGSDLIMWGLLTGLGRLIAEMISDNKKEQKSWNYMITGLYSSPINSATALLSPNIATVSIISKYIKAVSSEDPITQIAEATGAYRGIKKITDLNEN